MSSVSRFEKLGTEIFVGDERAEALLEVEIEGCDQGVAVEHGQGGLVDAAGEGRCGCRHGWCCSLGNRE